MAEVVNVSNAKGTGSKPGQWKLVAGLAGVLVLLLAFSGGGEDADESATDSLASTRPTGTDTRSESSAQREIHWPVIPLDFLLTHNPFQPGSSNVRQELTQEESESNYGSEENDSVVSASGLDQRHAPAFSAPPFAAEQDVAALAAKKVTMIFHSPKGVGAIIDNRAYYEGDRIRGSEYVVAAILKSGVTLRRADAVDAPLPPNFVLPEDDR